MNRLIKICFMVAVAATVFGVYASSARATCPPTCFVATNDDNPNGNTTSVWKWNSTTGALTAFGSSPYSTTGLGIGGGFFGIPRDAIQVGANGKCLFVGDAGTGDIAAFSYVAPNLKLVSTYLSTGGYSGALYGIGLTISGNTLYANYTNSSVIDTWTIGSGCTLKDNNVTATNIGGNGGVADGMVATSKCLIATYADGTLGTYTASPFAFVSYYTANGFNQYSSVPVAIHLVGSNLFADDIGSTTALYDSWPLNSSNCTLGTDTLSGPLSGSIFASDAFSVSPNGKLIYTVGTFSGTVQTDSVSGNTVANTNCADYSLTGYGTTFLYPGLSGVAVGTTTGTGLAVAEGNFGANQNGTSFVETMKINASGCLTKGAQTKDSSIYLLSLATYSGSPAN